MKRGPEPPRMGPARPDSERYGWECDDCEKKAEGAPPEECPYCGSSETHYQ